MANIIVEGDRYIHKLDAEMDRIGITDEVAFEAD